MRIKQVARKSTGRRAPRKRLGQTKGHSSDSDIPPARRDRQSSAPSSSQQPSKIALTDLPKEALSRIFEHVRQHHLRDYYYAMDRETGRVARDDAAMTYHRRLRRYLTICKTLLPCTKPLLYRHVIVEPAQPAHAKRIQKLAQTLDFEVLRSIKHITLAKPGYGGWFEKQPYGDEEALLALLLRVPDLQSLKLRCCSIGRDLALRIGRIIRRKGTVKSLQVNGYDGNSTDSGLHEELPALLAKGLDLDKLSLHRFSLAARSPEKMALYDGISCRSLQLTGISCRHYDAPPGTVLYFDGLVQHLQPPPVALILHFEDEYYPDLVPPLKGWGPGLQSLTIGAGEHCYQGRTTIEQELQDLPTMCPNLRALTITGHLVDIWNHYSAPFEALCECLPRLGLSKLVVNHSEGALRGFLGSVFEAEERPDKAELKKWEQQVQELDTICRARNIASVPRSFVNMIARVQQRLIWFSSDSDYDKEEGREEDA